MIVTRQIKSFSIPSVINIDKKIRSLARLKYCALDISICE